MIGYNTNLMRQYTLAPQVPNELAESLLPEEFRNINPLVSQLLFARGITTPEAAHVFLRPSYDALNDSFLMTDMERAVSRMLHAIQNGERIAVWSDYDCDGIPGAVLMHDFFSAIGYENVEYYIPHRHNEGFGLNTEGIDVLHARGVTLIMTIDCGITNVEQVSHAVSLGVDSIITDHHEPGAMLPQAYAILNPKRDDAYPFRELCGAGVAWKFVEAMLERGHFKMKEGSEKWWLDMVGLATMADMVPLVGENRTLAHFGMTVLRKTRRKGLLALLRAERISPHTLTDDDIGFTIAPRVNAASRMGVPHDAFHLFTTADDERAREGARHLTRVNNERKGVVASIVKEAKRRLKERQVGPVVVIGDPLWKPSLLGLAANTLAEEHAAPAFVWGRDGRGMLKGSCRAGGGVSVVALMEHARDVFIDYGGHHASGGFAVREECIHMFGDALASAHAHLGTQHDTALSVLTIDAHLELNQVNDELYHSIALLSPFGVGNSKPLFKFCGVIPKRITTFGKTGTHTKLEFQTRTGSINAIAFFTSPDCFTKKLGIEPVDLIGHIECATFMGRSELRIRVVDVVAINGI
jgi:single-stranded-DNA-specific exonuclease